MIEFAELRGLVTPDELRAAARQTLWRIGEAQGNVLRDLEPVERFVTVLGTLLEQRRIRLVEKGTSPDKAWAKGMKDIEAAAGS